MPHPLDHLVLPVTNIDLARERLGRLGFTVAAEGRHPFGTVNACVFFSDKTYLEPLGVASAKECEEAVRHGNVFVARDQAFRFRCGNDGFSAAVFATEDADADHAHFVRARKSGGGMLEFSRLIKMPDGSQSTGTFKLAFAADLRVPDFFLFACQRINAFPADRSALEKHANGATGISEIVLSAPEPEAFGSFLQLAVSTTGIERTPFGVAIASANTRISLLSPEGMEAYFDSLPLTADKGLRGSAIVFRTTDLAVTEALLADNGMTYTRKNNRVLVKPAPGQGAIFAFEETQ
ncbi:VOC family protein [Rhizobium sullae]|uniref:Glyoxalase-like protein n=1 Tax=Rhizobium sullae TaxID=50338 RepID=A0A4R3PXG4_RHISU|nr:VOC family protein [Rhizobium sullae]TCU13131.1 glyoxalase-like protein [Rhizobium sullae]